MPIITTAWKENYFEHNGKKEWPLLRPLLSAKLVGFKVHSHGESTTTSKNDFTIEVHVAAEVAEASVCVNRSIHCHKTHCLRQEKIDVVTDAVAPCEWALTACSVALANTLFTDLLQWKYITANWMKYAKIIWCTTWIIQYHYSSWWHSFFSNFSIKC